jgi:hypothetical protein
MAKVCPQCNLSNPDDAVRCGCGCGCLLVEADSLEHWAPSVLGAFAQVEDEVPAGAEESSTATVLPSRLPNPLGDPLRALRYFVSFFGILEIACLVILPGIVFEAKVNFPDALGSYFGVVVSTYWLWSILPGRAVNAFYLRSFRNDPATWPIRKAAQAALGRKFRLSGIRDPRRRWLPVIRYMHAAFFAIRCCTPKFMNLEAGADWKARLWRSLGDARCALIDVSHLTPFVLEEIELCCRCLGLKRILFIGDSSRSHDDSQQRIGEACDWLDPTTYHAIRVAIWDASSVGRKLFLAKVRAFAAELPAGVAGLKAEALPLVQSSGSPEGAPAGGIGGDVGEVVLGILLGAIVSGVYNLVLLALGSELRQADVLIAWLRQLPFVAFLAIEFYFLVGYAIDSSGWERVRSLAVIAISIFSVVVFVLLPDVQRVRLAAARISTANNLKQIGLAMHSYNDAAGALPAAAIYDKSGKPPLSLFGAILPYIEEGTLYQQFKRDEPWNSPNDIRLVSTTDAEGRATSKMLKTYACPADTTAPPGYTYYRVFVGNGAPFNNEFNAGMPRSFPDGTANTILIVEAGEAAPWTKPDELQYNPNGPLPPLGGHFPDRFGAVFADGHVEIIPQDVKEFTLRALITRDGGEILGTDW